MLVLTRKLEEEIFIGGCITIKVLSVRDGKIRIGIDAPRHIPIVRAEIATDEETPPARST